MKTYEEIWNHQPDFIVSYKLYSPEERRQNFFQHIRCDFMYDGDDPEQDGIYMIHPEFIDDQGVLFDEKTPIPLTGHASMWILVPEMRESVHRSRIKKRVKGYFMSGARKLGEVVVEEIIGLYENIA